MCYRLLRRDRGGRCVPLGGIDAYAVPSPDGRHLAMREWTVEGNLWLLENF
jgi:hypothetical protein